MAHPRKGRTKSPSGNCIKCGTWRQSLHRDHILPRWKGGGEEPDNIQLLCANCHEEKTAEDMKGHPVSEEQKQNQSRRMKGFKWTAEQRAAHSKRLLGKKKGPWSQERKNGILEERRTRWTPERRLAHSILGKQDWNSLTDEQRAERVSGLAWSQMTAEEQVASATKASLIAKAIRDALTPEEKATKRLQRAKATLAKLNAQLAAQGKAS